MEPPSSRSRRGRLPCAVGVAPSDTSGTRAPGTGVLEARLGPLRWASTGVGGASQGLPRKDGAPQHPSRFTPLRGPNAAGAALGTEPDAVPCPASAHAPQRRARPPRPPSSSSSTASPHDTDHSDRSRRARSRPSKERSGAGGRHGSHGLAPPLGRAAGASRAWGRAENTPDRSANHRVDLHCVPARHTPRD